MTWNLKDHKVINTRSVKPSEFKDQRIGVYVIMNMWSLTLRFNWFMRFYCVFYRGLQNVLNTFMLALKKRLSLPIKVMSNVKADTTSYDYIYLYIRVIAYKLTSSTVYVPHQNLIFLTSV